MSTSTNLEHYIPEELQKIVFDKYYSHLSERLTLESIINDKHFIEDPAEHIALYTDHGIVHVRNVCATLLSLTTDLNGVLIPKRDAKRIEFMRGYGAVLAFLHDIGMINTTPFGRITHAAYLLHEVFMKHFDPIIKYIWNNNVGGLAWKILTLSQQFQLKVEPLIMLREMIALGYCHSKSSISMDLINDVTALRKFLQDALKGTMNEIYWNNMLRRHSNKNKDEAREQVEKAQQDKKGRDSRYEHYSQYYANMERDAFAWLVDTNKGLEPFVDDVMDTVRMLRVADAARQRGTDLKTSASYEIFVDQNTANSIFGLRSSDERLFLLEVEHGRSAAEANVNSLSFTPEGDVMFSFFRGAFATPEATQKAIKGMTIIVEDIHADVVGSFERAHHSHSAAQLPYSKKNRKIHTVLESTSDNPQFVHDLKKSLVSNNPDLASSIKIYPSLYGLPKGERERYLHAESIDDDELLKAKILRNVKLRGHYIPNEKASQAFELVKKASLYPGEILAMKGDLAGFVYIPMSRGVKGDPGGGYAQFEVSPWVLVGITGVVRGGIRNATLVANRNVQVLIIPRESYLEHWHYTYSVDQIGLIRTRLLHP